jgi:transport inhibitor response 1
LRVYPATDEGFATEEGLIAISEGCPKLKKILYFCKQMTNAACITFAKNLPELTHFRLCILTPRQPDHTTQEPMDTGFGAVAQYCTNLTRLAVSGLLTDRAFEYIGRYGKKLETISLAFNGESGRGMEYLLNGCSKLKKLEIRDCPFGDEALLSGMHRYESMRSLWLSYCHVSRPGAYALARRMPRLNVEIIKGEEESADSQKVEHLYVYRSIAGPRKDTPHFVETLHPGSVETLQ